MDGLVGRFSKAHRPHLARQHPGHHVRESGDIEGSAPCKIVGPCGEVEIPCGVT